MIPKNIRAEDPQDFLQIINSCLASLWIGVSIRPNGLMKMI